MSRPRGVKSGAVYGCLKVVEAFDRGQSHLVQCQVCGRIRHGSTGMLNHRPPNCRACSNERRRKAKISDGQRFGKWLVEESWLPNRPGHHLCRHSCGEFRLLSTRDLMKHTPRCPNCRKSS